MNWADIPGAGGGPLCRRVQPVQVSGPVKNTAIGRNEPVSAKRGSNYQVVGRISMQFCQKAGERRYSAVHGNFDDPVLKKGPAPGVQSNAEVDLVLPASHADFPKGNGGNGGIIPQ